MEYCPEDNDYMRYKEDVMFFDVNQVIKVLNILGVDAKDIGDYQIKHQTYFKHVDQYDFV